MKFEAKLLEAVVEEVEQSSTDWKMGGLTPGSSTPHVDVSFGKILKLFPISVPTVYKCV